MELIKQLRERRAAIKAKLDALVADEAGELRSLTPEEDAEFGELVTELRAFDARIDELIEADRREKLAAAAYVSPVTTATVTVTHEPNPVYRKDDLTKSFFRDLAGVNLNRSDFMAGSGTLTEARERLVRSQETRAGDMTSVAGAGGEFAPPLWLIEDFIPYLRAGRTTANLMHSAPLPSGVASINLPKVATGATTAIQALQNSSLSDTAMTTTSVTSGISTIAGQQIISMQLLQQSGIPFDQVILSDLARDYAKQLDTQVLSGTGSSGQLRGLAHAAGLGATTFTSAAPAVVSVTSANSFYNKIISAANAIEAVFITPTVIVMHPQRWNWVLEALDTANRPLILPNGPVFNAVGQTNGPTVEGAAGTLLGMPVYTDANIPVNIGGGTNQDVVYVLNSDMCWLFESPLQTASFDATYANQASILFRVLGYAAFIPDRYAGAVNAINGTGLVTPTL